MSDTSVKRPPTLAGACVYLGALAAILAIRAITLVTTWNADSRAKEFDRVIDTIRDLGASQAGAETGYKIFLTVVAVVAACAVVFAVYTARGDRASRFGLTATIGLAGVAAFLGFLGGGIFVAMVGALAVVFSVRLWTGEIRLYFRALAGHAPPPPKAAPPAPVPALVQQTAPQPDPVQPYPSYPPQPYPGQQVRQQPVGAMPKSVSIAVWTTFIGSAVVASASALGLLSLALIGGDYEQMMRDSPFGDDFLTSSGMTYDQLYRSSLAILGICLALSLGGLVASILALVKRRSGDVFLFVMTVVTIVASVLLVPVGLPWTAAAIVCVVQLRKPEAKAWFAAT